MDIVNKLLISALLLGSGFVAGQYQAQTAEVEVAKAPDGILVQTPVTAGAITDLKNQWESANGRELFWVEDLPVIGEISSDKVEPVEVNAKTDGFFAKVTSATLEACSNFKPGDDVFFPVRVADLQKWSTAPDAQPMTIEEFYSLPVIDKNTVTTALAE